MFVLAEECLQGKALKQYKRLLDDPTGAYQPVNAANRSVVQFDRSLKDLSSKMHDFTFLGDQVLQIVQGFKWHQMKANLSQPYQDKPSDQEVRIDNIVDYAQNKVHIRSQIPTDYD